MNALAFYGESGTSPGLARVAYLFEGPHRYTSIRVDNPEDFTDLPARFVLRRVAGSTWLVDTSCPKSHVRSDR